jgi:uncharacterized protein YfaS (alpha-2-macroglobulin family)
MFPKSYPVTGTLLLMILVTLFSCNNQPDQPTQEIPDNLSTYVYAFTSGNISRVSPIRVQLSQAVATPDQIGQAADEDLLRFTPAIAGSLVWEDAQTLQFSPDAPLPSGTAYTANIALRDLFEDVPGNLKSFAFSFRTKDQYYDISFESLAAPNPSDLKVQEYSGKITTTDMAEDESVEKILSATQNGKTLPVRWAHYENGTVHEFTVEQIARGNNASSVRLSWDGAPLGVDVDGNSELEVPALGDFKVLTAQIIQGSEQYVLLTFSDPLKASQTVDGLVSISNFTGDYRFLIDGAQLRIYPSQRIAGERNIRVESGLRNISNSRMGAPSDWVVNFVDVKPQVRLVGRGVIMPDSEGLIFPFEAVSLTAVEVEIFKIFNNNILQHLQRNNLDGNYDLYRVGRIIMQEKVVLSNLNPGASATQWTRYALDLNDLIQEDPDAIYQVRIGFRPEYSTYYCEGQDSKATSDDMARADDNYAASRQQIRSIMDGWYGIDGWYQGYNWQDRENPCKPAYYNSDRFLQRNVIASNMGMIAKQGKDGSHFIAITDLRTTDPVSGAQVKYYDFQQQLLGTATTGPDGFAEINLEGEEKPFVVIATKGADKGYLKIQNGDALSMSRFNVAGATTQKGLKGFLYADRGVWRPGDSVFLNFILEDKGKTLPANYPVNFELFDARGQLYQKRATAVQVNNIYPLHFNTSPDDQTGNWRATVKVGGASFSKTIKIETVKPNRLKIDLGLAGQELTAADNPASFTLTSTWLHGAPASNLKAKVEIMLVNSRTSFPKHKGYVFDDPSRRYVRPEPRTFFEGTLDGNGQATITGDLSGSQQLPGKVNVRFKTRVFEKGGDFSTDQFSVPFWPYGSYVGIDLPKSDYGENRIEVDREGTIRFVAVDYKGNPIKGRKLSVGLYNVNWRWWWDRGSDNVSRYNSKDHYQAKSTQTVTTDGEGAASWTVKPDKWGRYLVRVCDTESGHCTGDFFYAGYPWHSNDNDPSAREAATMLAFSSDKETYAPGETVSLKIPTGEEGRALITIENGTKVVQSFWATATKGENTFTFEATEEMTPTVYAHVALLQPHAQVQNDLPIRLYGVIPIKVENPETHLQPIVEMPDVLEPEKEFTLEVSEKSGVPMAYTVAIVDDGLLALTRHKTPQPWDAFYAREALGVRTWDVYDQVLGAYGGELERILSIGGDGAEAVSPEDQRANRFKPVVMHLGPFYLKKGKTARHKITMPNYIGSVRTMVVAANNGAYGNAEKTTPVRQPVMVLGTLPRVLSPGEQVKLPVNVFAMEDNIKKVTVKVEELTGLANIQGSSTKTVNFTKVGDQLVDFDINLKEFVGVARFLITAKSGSEEAKHEIEIQVRNPNPYVTKVVSDILDPGEEWSKGFEAVGMPGTNEGVLEVSSIPPINLGKRLDYLIRYPYGCLEQTLSGGFPQLYVTKLLNPSEEQKKRIPEHIQETINRLRRFQTGTGGFAYWPGQAQPNQWSTNYAGHFLMEAKALGYPVPPALVDNWVRFQKKTARMWDPNWEKYGFYSRSTSNLTQAYRLYTLALAKQPDLASMNRLREQPNLGSIVQWRLAAAYALAGKPEVARSLITNLGVTVADYTELSYTYGSSMRDQAMILETLVVLGENKRAAALVKTIATQLNSNRWWGTHSVAYALMAIGKYVGENDVDDQMSFSATIAGNTTNQGANKPIIQLPIPVDKASDKGVSMKNTGKNTLFANMILKGQPLAGQEEDMSNDLTLSVRYVSLNGQPLDVTNIPQGTDFVAEVTVRHPNGRPEYFRDMALDQIFPSGWEILNTRMSNMENFKAEDLPDYQDFRDDRVYMFFGIAPNSSRTFKVQLNAAYQGRFYLPAVSCSAMYDNTVSAARAGQWVEVTAPSSI